MVERVKNLFKNVPLIAFFISIIGNGIQGYQIYSNKKQHEEEINNYGSSKFCVGKISQIW
ncbi:MAG: hypothetical protein HW406_1123 [Candidatus Brocadiaceae bacterium]|nr:hypothetical protein [Candidatus Brocadiaceae bacterium]